MDIPWVDEYPMLGFKIKINALYDFMIDELNQDVLPQEIINQLNLE